MTTPEYRPPIWLRRTTESSPAWAAFTTYRDMGSDRSLVKLGRKLGKNATTLEGWSVRHEWQIRVAEWEANEDDLWQVEKRRMRRTVEQRHAMLAAKMMEKSLEAVLEQVGKGLTPREVARWVAEAAKLDKIIYGVDVGEDGPTATAVRILVDPRLLPADAVLPADGVVSTDLGS